MPDFTENPINKKIFAEMEALFDEKGNIKLPKDEDGVLCIADREVEPVPIEWAWQHYIPTGALTILEGDPEAGKSTIACTLSALWTSGRMLPGDATEREPMNVGFVSGEDGAEETLSPRFRIAGGDGDRMFYYTGMKLGGYLEFPRDLAPFIGWIEDFDLDVVWIDPLSAFTDSSIDSHNNVSVRRMLSPISKVAKMTHTSVVIIGHLVKQEGRKAIHAGQGSVAYAAAARSVLLAAEHPDEEEDGYVLASTKCNLSAREDRPTLGYTLDKVGYEYSSGAIGEMVKLGWTGIVDLTANHVTKGEKKSKLTMAKEAIIEALELHPLSGDDLWMAVKPTGVSKKTFERARTELVAEGRLLGTQNADKSWKWDLIV